MGKKGSEKTETQFLSREDAARTRQGRQYGDLASQAALGVQEAGIDPRTMEALRNYQNLYGSYGDMADFGTGFGTHALGFAGQTGLQGLDRYANPYIGMQLAGMDPLYDRMRADQYSGAGQDATQAGAFGGSRHAKLAAMRLGGVDRQQAQQYGDIYANSAQQAMHALMSERGRMGQLGFGGLNLGMQGLQGQGQMSGNIANLGDYFRNIQQMQNERGAKNAAMAAQMQQGTYGRDISKTRTTKEEKGWMEGALPLAMNIGKMFIPGGQASALTGLLNQGGPTQGSTPWMDAAAQDPWQGMNLGMGGYGGGSSQALFNPVPPGGFFGGG
jgi:hypothetical protein